MLRTQSSSIERLTQQISSVSTEQLPTGVKIFGEKPDETSERPAKTENEQTSKEVKQQEVNSLVEAPRNEEPATGNTLRECEQNFETLEKKSNLQVFAKRRHSSIELLLEDTTEQSWTWMTVSNFELPRAEIHDFAHAHVLGSGTKPLRGRVTSSRTRTQSHK